SVRMFPLLVDGADLPQADELPEDLKDLVGLQGHKLTVRHWRADVNELIGVLKRIPDLGGSVVDKRIDPLDVSDKWDENSFVLGLKQMERPAKPPSIVERPASLHAPMIKEPAPPPIEILLASTSELREDLDALDHSLRIFTESGRVKLVQWGEPLDSLN